jgi:hypothetical protein
VNTTPEIRNKRQGKSLLQVPRINAFLKAIVDDGTDWKIAAKANGLRLGRARVILVDKAVRAEYYRLCDVNRMAERARNIHARTVVRDRAFDPEASAAELKVALDAANQLDGTSDNQSIIINGSNNNVIAGYVVKLDGPATEPRAIGNRMTIDAKPLKSLDAVTQDDE